MLVNQIIEKFNEILTPVLKVYKYETITINEYPCVIVNLVKYEDSYLSYGKIKRVFDFQLKFYHFCEDENQIENTISNLYDKVENSVNLLNQRQNINFGGLVDFSNLSVGDFRIIDRAGFLLTMLVNVRLTKTLDF